MGAAEVYGTTGNGYESDAELLVLATGPLPALELHLGASCCRGGEVGPHARARPSPPGAWSCDSGPPRPRRHLVPGAAAPGMVALFHPRIRSATPGRR